MIDLKSFPPAPSAFEKGSLVAYQESKEKEAIILELHADFSGYSDDWAHTPSMSLIDENGDKISVHPDKVHPYPKDPPKEFQDKKWLLIDGNLALAYAGYWGGVTDKNCGIYVLKIFEYDIHEGMSQNKNLIFDSKRMKIINDPKQIKEAEQIKKIALLQERLPAKHRHGGEDYSKYRPYYEAVAPHYFEENGLFSILKQEFSSVSDLDVLKSIHKLNTQNRELLKKSQTSKLKVSP